VLESSRFSLTMRAELLLVAAMLAGDQTDRAESCHD